MVVMQSDSVISIVRAISWAWPAYSVSGGGGGGTLCYYLEVQRKRGEEKRRGKDTDDVDENPGRFKHLLDLLPNDRSLLSASEGVDDDGDPAIASHLKVRIIN